MRNLHITFCIFTIWYVHIKMVNMILLTLYRKFLFGITYRKNGIWYHMGHVTWTSNSSMALSTFRYVNILWSILYDFIIISYYDIHWYYIDHILLTIFYWPYFLTNMVLLDPYSIDHITWFKNQEIHFFIRIWDRLLLFCPYLSR